MSLGVLMKVLADHMERSGVIAMGEPNLRDTVDADPVVIREIRGWGLDIVRNVLCVEVVLNFALGVQELIYCVMFCEDVGD